MKLSRPLVVLDLETTGTWIEKDRIVEIGMVKLQPDGQRETYVRRVNPGIPIPPKVSKLIGITDQDVQNEPPFRQIAQEVLDFLEGADLAGFNVERFDLPLLEREIFETGLRFEWRSRTTYDAQKIYHVHEKRDLTAAYQFYCQKTLTDAHAALADTEATLEILASQIQKYGKGDDSIESLGDFKYKSADEFFDESRKFRWWNKELYPAFGRYAKKKHLKQIVEKDPKYLEWMLTSDFSEEVKELIRNALDGKFPEYQKSAAAKTA